MIGRDSHIGSNGYGFGPWILGLVVAGVIVYIMFGFAQSIS